MAQQECLSATCINAIDADSADCANGAKSASELPKIWNPHSGDLIFVSNNDTWISNRNAVHYVVKDKLIEQVKPVNL
jgi:hypothetical protein